jgi:hypothetical protein
MPLGFQAIRPKRYEVIDPRAVVSDLEKTNRQYALDIGKGMSKYPSQKPTRYKRTGNYGRGWTAPGAVKASASEVTLVNRVGYSVYVGGPLQGGVGERQTKVMRGKGWPSITNVARDTKKNYVQLVNKAIRGRPG